MQQAVNNVAAQSLLPSHPPSVTLQDETAQTVFQCQCATYDSAAITPTITPTVALIKSNISRSQTIFCLSFCLERKLVTIVQSMK